MRWLRYWSEPRYGEAAHSRYADGLDQSAEPVRSSERSPDAERAGEQIGDEQQMRWVRHSLGRRLADDPAMRFDELTEAERRYVDHPSGRRWLRQQMRAVGLHVEEHAEGWLAVDADAIATDSTFPGPHGNAAQLALLLIDELVV